MQLEVTGNTIRRGALPGGQVGATNWVALRVPGPAVDFRGGDLLLVPVEGRTFILTNTRVRLLAGPKGHAAVCGNLIEAWGGTAHPVDLTVGGTCTFAHNRCVVLDNAKYQRNATVQALAKTLGIDLLYLPSYSPNLNLIERLWRFLKRRTLYGRYYPVFADFKAAIERTISELPTKYKNDLQSLMTHNFQQFEDVSLLAA